MGLCRILHQLAHMYIQTYSRQQNSCITTCVLRVIPVVNKPKQVNPDAAMTFTAVYCPSIVARMYRGLPMRDSVAVVKLTTCRGTAHTTTVVTHGTCL